MRDALEFIPLSPLFVCSLKMQLNATFQVTFIVGISFIFITRREHNLWHNEERELLARDALQVCGIKLLFSSTSRVRERATDNMKK